MKLSKTLFTALFSLTALSSSLHSAEQWVYFGTAGGDAKGIYVASFDSDSGKLSEAKLAIEANRPGFLAIHPNQKNLYAIAAAIPEHEAKETGGLSAYSIDTKTGELMLINQQPSGGRGPCHVSLDHQGRVALVANYSGGSVSSMAIDQDGSLKKPASFFQHQGSSVNKKRQKAPHAHSANPGPNDQYAFVADLGIDKVMIYKLDPATAKMEKHGAGIVPPGSGPRHFAFHPNGKWAYTNGEMTMTVTGFNFDAKQGTLTAMQTIGTVPEGIDFTGLSTAEVQVHKNGKFLYVSNRGHDTITVFSIDPKNGKLTFVEREGIQGETPRNFGIDNTGNYLLAAGQKSHTIAVFKIDQKTGELEFTNNKIEVPTPICVKFLDKK
ncbi:MAG: lactonase family protein [Verrucomicrobiales bacterium]|nr:lactonase family protein [Verrucomicrobiales bacterium]